MAGLLPPGPPSAGGMTLPAPLPTAGGLLPDSPGLLPASTDPPEPAFDPTPWGFVQNIASGLGNMVIGLGTLFIGAPAHDLAQGVAHLIPGEQPVENEPSQLATIARTILPGAWVPGEDLGGKWGALVSDTAHRWGGASNIVRGLYEDPLSYVMDALMVSGGVGAVAKAGRAGALAKLPALVSDTAATRILGPALTVNETVVGPGRYAYAGRYGARPFASMSGGGPHIETLKVSSNPLARGVQNLIYNKLGSLSPEDAALTPLAGAGAPAGTPMVAFGRAQQAIDLANTEGLRVLRPGLGEFIARHDTSKLLSARRVQTSSLMKDASEDVSIAAYGGPTRRKVYDPLTDEYRDLDAEVASEYARGTATPLESPSTAPINLGTTWNMLDEAPSPDDIAPYDGVAFEDATVINSKISNKFGTGKEKRANTTPLNAPESPFAPAGGSLEAGGGNKARFQFPIESLDQADQAVDDVARALGYTPEGRISTLSDGANPWDALHYYLRRPDGSRIEISVGTPDMLFQQAQAAHHIANLKRIQNEVGELYKELANPQLDDVARVQIASRIRMLQRESNAGFEYTRSLFDDTRAQWWSEHGGGVYVPELKAAYRLRAVADKWYTRDWMKKVGGDTPYTTMMERAYQPLRATRLYESMTRIREGLEEIMRREPREWVPKKGAVEGRTYRAVPKDVHQHEQLLDIIRLMERELPNMDEATRDVLLDTILGDRPLFNSVKDPSRAALRLTRRFRNKMWDYTTVEGGHGKAFGLPEYDWTTMHNSRILKGLPTAQYVPDLPKGNPSSYFRRGKQLTTNATPTAYSKRSLGLLYETGRQEPDLLKVIQRKAQITIEHNEMAQLATTLVERYGRVITQQEAKLIEQYGVDTGEVFVSPQMARAHFTLRAKLLESQLDNYLLLDDMPTGKGRLQAATQQAVDEWASDVFEETINGLGTAQVWAIPKAVSKKLDQEITTRFGNNVKIFWDTPMSLWKASVLSLSPRWIINNFFGNTIFMGIENPAALRHAIRGLDTKQRRLVASVLGEDNLALDEMGFYNPVTDYGGRTASEFIQGSRKHQVARAAIAGDRDVAGSVRTFPSRTLLGVSGKIKHLNSIIEQSARRGVLIDELSKRNLTGWVGLFHKSHTTLREIAENGVDPATMDAALKGVDRALGNFMQYGPVEQNIIRRFFMPFYGFYRHMTNVLLKFPVEHPLKGSLASLVGEMNESMLSGMPEYLQDQMPIHLGTIGGKDTILRLKNMNPLSLITDDYPIIGVLNPALKIIMERGLGISTFTGEDFPMPENGSMVQTSDGRYWNVERDQFGNVLGVSSSGKPLPSILTHLGGQFGPISMLPGFSLYPKSTLLNLAGYAGVPLTQPKTSLASSVAFDQEMQEQAVAAATPDLFES